MRGHQTQAISAAALFALVFTAAACTGDQSVLRPAGPAADRLATLGSFVMITFAVTTAVMGVIFTWLLLRRRGTLAEHEPWNVPDPKGWIIIGGILVPLVTLSIVFVYSDRTMASFPMQHGDHMSGAQSTEHAGRPTIRLVGNQWWWEVDYLSGDVHDQVTTANEIHIPVGEPVDIQLESRDVIHSFWVPRLHGKVDLIPGQVNYIRIQADAPGVYRGQCAEYCGQQHARMVLLVVAQPKSEFESWLVHQRQPSPPPVADAARQGQTIFLSRQCAMCHTVRGTEAMGAVGPDLTHLAGRQRIAANSYDNNTANLSAWVTHAQSMKPGAQMPNMTQFDGEQLHELVTYLQTLK